MYSDVVSQALINNKFTPNNIDKLLSLIAIKYKSKKIELNVDKSISNDISAITVCDKTNLFNTINRFTKFYKNNGDVFLHYHVLII